MNVLIVFILYFKTILLLLRWDTGKVRDRIGCMSRVKNECMGQQFIAYVTVITNAIKQFLIYTYNVNACLYTISALYQIIN